MPKQGMAGHAGGAEELLLLLNEHRPSRGPGMPAVAEWWPQRHPWSLCISLYMTKAPCKHYCGS